MSRDIFSLEVFHSVPAFRLYFLVVGQAMFKDGVTYNGHTLKAGEWIRSIRQLQSDLEYIDRRVKKQYGIATIKRAIEQLIAEHLLCTKQLDCGTLFSVPNYARLQGLQEKTSVISERIAEHETGFIETKRYNVLQDIIPADINTRARNTSYFDDFYISYGQQPTPKQIQALNQYIDNDGLNIDMICLAIDKASRVSGHFNYLTGILNSWIKKGIKTKDQAEQENNVRSGTHDSEKQPQKHKYSDLDLNW